MNAILTLFERHLNADERTVHADELPFHADYRPFCMHACLSRGTLFELPFHALAEERAALQAALEIEYPHGTVALLTPTPPSPPPFLLTPPAVHRGIPRAKQLASPAKRVMEASAAAEEEKSHAMRDHLAQCRPVGGGYSDVARRSLAARAMDYNLQVMRSSLSSLTLTLT